PRRRGPRTRANPDATTLSDRGGPSPGRGPGSRRRPVLCRPAAMSHVEESSMTDPTSGPDWPEMPDSAADGDPSPQGGAGRGPAGASDPGQNLSPAEQIEQLKKERDDYREQSLRSRADFANYQKRAKQQADADRAYAVGSLAKDLLDPLDNLARAVDALRSSRVEGITAG